MSDKTIIVRASATGAASNDISSLKQLLDKSSVHQIILQIPEKYCAKIGRITTIWAYNEWLLAGLLCLLLKIDRPEYRAIFPGTRTNEIWNKSKQLLDLYKITVQTDLASFATNLGSGEAARNLVSHGIWILHNSTKQLCVQNTSGQWVFEGEKPSSKRRYPEAFPIDDAWLDTTTQNMTQWIADTSELMNQVEIALTP